MSVTLDVSDDFIRRITKSIDLRPSELPSNNPIKFSEKAEPLPNKKFHNKKIEITQNFIRRITESINLQALASNKNIINVRKQNTIPTLFIKKKHIQEKINSLGVLYI